MVGLELDDGAAHLAEALVGDADHGHVLDGGVSREEVLDLDGVDVLAAHDDDVLLAVDQPDETVIVHARHVAGEEPTIVQGLLGGLGIVVVAAHDAGALDPQLAGLALRHLGTLGIGADLALPAVAGHADGAHVIDVLEAQVHAAGAGALGEAVVGIVFVMREHLLPSADEALGHGLRADVHEAPLVELVVGQVDLAALDGGEDVLRPGHEQPHVGAALAADRLEDGLGRHAAQQHRASAGVERAHPVELRARVVERRDAEEHVVVNGLVVARLHLGGLRKREMRVQDGLGEAGGAARVVDRAVLVEADGDARVVARAVARELEVVLGEVGAHAAHEEEQAVARDGTETILHAAHELGPEDQGVCLGLGEAVLDLGAGVAEVERHRHGAGLEDAEVDGQPFEAVVEQDGDLVALADAAREQQVGEAVGLLVEDAPGDLAAIGLGLG